MAGAYPDVPGHRIAYHRDGSTMALLNLTAGTATPTTEHVNYEAADRIVLNNFGLSQTFAYGVLFPAPMDLVGYFLTMYWQGNNTEFLNPDLVQTSTDTTNLLDGTWTDAALVTHGASKDNMRNLITPLVRAGVKGIRARVVSHNIGAGEQAIDVFHLYGSPATGAMPNRQRFWHPTLDQEVDGAYADFGDIARNSIVTIPFRVKNPSATLTAHAVSLTREALTDTAPSNISAYTFSADDLTYADSLVIGDLAPGEISPVVYVKRHTTAGAIAGLWNVQFVAAGSSYA